MPSAPSLVSRTLLCGSLLAFAAAPGHAVAPAKAYPVVVSQAASAQAAKVVAQADAFLATLTKEQRGKVLYRFDDAAERARWSNFPTGFVPRGGINLKSMTAQQKAAALDLLQTVLSPTGYRKVTEIRQADDDFRQNGSKRGPGGGGRGPGNGPPPGGPRPGAAPRAPMNPDEMFGGELYYIAFLGQPSRTAPWMLQFGGHHLALNITMVGAKGIMTPSLTGAQPATFTLAGKTVRPLAAESDKALALLGSLTPEQRGKAVLNYQVADLVLGPGQDGKRIAPEGLKVSAMTAPQKAMLLDLMAEWVGILNDAAAAPRLAQLQAELDQSYFAWSGPTTGEPGSNITAYYRIQGPHVVIEYAPQRDEPNNHIHTIYRDPTDDYGQLSAAVR